MTMQAHADRIAAVLRPIAPDGVLKAPEVPHLDEIAKLWAARSATGAAEPGWLTVARSLIGQREIPGPQHNSWIATGWARLGASWYNSDETPWCGFFIAHCIDAAGLPIPKSGSWAAAKTWASYGAACPAALGAIAVKQRPGGNHVFFIVGETPDKRFFKALGGNQSNAVTIMDIAKSDAFAIRWPDPRTPRRIGLPVLPRGVISRNEA